MNVNTSDHYPSPIQDGRQPEDDLHHDVVVASLSRRQLLGVLAAGAGMVVSGCGDYGSSTNRADVVEVSPTEDPPLISPEPYDPPKTQAEKNAMADQVDDSARRWAVGLARDMIANEAGGNLVKGDNSLSGRDWGNEASRDGSDARYISRLAQWRPNDNADGGVFDMQANQSYIAKDQTFINRRLQLSFQTSTNFDAGSDTHMLDIINDPTTTVRRVEYVDGQRTGTIFVDRAPVGNVDGVPAGTVQEVPVNGADGSMSDQDQLNSVLSRADNTAGLLNITR